MALLKALLGLFGALAGLFRDRQLLDAGRATQKAQAQEKVIKDVQTATDVRNAVERELAVEPHRLREHDPFERRD